MTPQLVDLDRDGRQDLVSGSWPGDVYWFRRRPDGTFGEPRALLDKTGNEVNVGAASAVFVADWRRDGDMDLIIGTIDGQVHILANESSGAILSLGAPKAIELPGRTKKYDAAPVVVDWDGDGRDDLVVGADDGSVYWYRNTESVSEPGFNDEVCLVPPSPSGWNDDESRNAGDWGLRTKICATDWNGDGKVDLLMGDRCGGFSGKPQQLEQERRQEIHSIQQLPELRREWASTFRRYRAITGSDDEVPDRKHAAHVALNELKALKAKIATAEQAVSKHAPQRQTHGFVWLLLRK